MTYSSRGTRAHSVRRHNARNSKYGSSIRKLMSSKANREPELKIGCGSITSDSTLSDLALPARPHLLNLP